MSDDVFFDPFTTTHFASHADLEDHDSHAWHGFQVDLRLSSGLLTLAQSQNVKLDPLRVGTFVLDIDDIPLPNLDPSPHGSRASTDDELSESRVKGDLPETPTQIKEEEEDIWASRDVQKPIEQNRLITWDIFLDPHHETPPTAYLSEAGSPAFDAFLRRFLLDEHPGETIRYAKPQLFTSALLDLALGRESLLFKWNPQAKQFEVARERYTVSGISEQVVQEITSTFLRYGSQYRQLEDFVHAGRHDNPVEIAFARALGDVLITVKDSVESRRMETVTALQVQELFRKPFEAVDGLTSMLGLFSNHEQLGRFMHALVVFVEKSSATSLILEDTLFQILARVVQPWLQLLNHRIGLQHTQTTAAGHLVTACDQILSVSIVKQIESTETLLNDLQQVAPKKASQLMAAVQNCVCFFGVNWEQVDHAHACAEIYERRCRNALQNGQSGPQIPSPNTYSIHDGSGPSDQEDDPFLFRPEYFNDAASTSPLKGIFENSLKEAVGAMLSAGADPTFEMPIAAGEALELSITPLVAAQHRILSYSILQSLFNNFNIIDHLQIMWRFHLMGDGPFTSRLSTALFDAKQASGDTRRTTGSTTGLRLQKRDTWPPASSELRLVLMDILSESISDIKDDNVVHTTSFAIRELPDDELEKCRNVDSIHALDFLRLHYKAPNSILESLITSRSLKRYDRIFMHLLRLLRVKNLTQHLLHETCARDTRDKRRIVEDGMDPFQRRLRWSLHQFASALANYTQNVAIYTHWHNFENTVLAVQTRLAANDYDGTLLLANSPEHMRYLHEQSLERITQALFLEKSQIEVRETIEDIFAIILRYASVVLTGSSKSNLRQHQTREDRNENDNDNDIDKTKTIKSRPNLPSSLLAKEFETKLKTLLNHLKKLSSRGTEEDNNFRHGNKDNDKDDRLNGIAAYNSRERAETETETGMATMAEQLLLALDFGGYYNHHHHK